MSFKHRIVLAFLGVLFLGGGCKRDQEPTTTSPATGGQGEIVIGSILPLTGDGAAYGIEIKNGIDLAVEQTNAQGGIGGTKLRVIYEDSQGDAKNAVSAFRKLTSQHKVPVVIGDSFSGPTLAIAPIAQREKVVLFSPTASSPKLSSAGPYFFRNWPSDTAEASVVAELAIQKLGKKRCAVLYSNSEYGIGLRDVFIRRVQELGGEIIRQEAFREKDTDFRTQLQNIKSVNPDALYMTGYYQEFAQILKQAKELGLQTQFLSCGTFHEPQVISLSGGAAEGVIFVQPYYDPHSDAQHVREFVNRFEAKFGIAPGLYAAHGYDAAEIVAKAIEGAASFTGSALADELHQTKDYLGVTGPTTFTAQGDVVKPCRVMTVRNGQFVDLD
ncbi:MAG: ABC transporter substrate-binding protein [Armatimonadetes bacterium]|nr:ABC transporter substrate-binding protein [Armatimonadota bacterium]